ncbi:MAG TPA: molybdopterin-guanine dinucleotide biosynthesis protein B [Gammaproteobacteria bacterium]
MAIEFPLPLVGFVAYSGTGKTTLLEQVIPELRRMQLRVGLIKHAHHDFDIDIPGKDSWRLRQAGASQVLVASKKRWALITEHEARHTEPQLRELLHQLDTALLDLVLVEGFKHEPFPKIELRRSELARPELYPEDPHIIAVANDMPHSYPCPLPLLDINQPQQIARFIITHLLEKSPLPPRSPI